jgi:hypothetical protein
LHWASQRASGGKVYFIQALSLLFLIYRSRPILPKELPGRIHKFVISCVFVPLIAEVHGGSLFLDGSWRRLLRVAAGHERQVVAHKVDSYGHHHKEHANPKTPIVMSAFPVRARVVMNMVAIRCYLLAVIVLALMHGSLSSRSHFG